MGVRGVGKRMCSRGKSGGNFACNGRRQRLKHLPEIKRKIVKPEKSG
jgi:hypothetical protein